MDVFWLLYSRIRYKVPSTNNSFFLKYHTNHRICIDSLTWRLHMFLDIILNSSNGPFVALWGYDFSKGCAGPPVPVNRL